MILFAYVDLYVYEKLMVKEVNKRMDILDVKNLIKKVPKEHSIVLLGPPGVGKTTVIRQIARELAKERGLEFAEYPRDKEMVKSNPEKVFVFYPIPLTTRDVVELTGPLRVVRGVAKLSLIHI